MIPIHRDRWGGVHAAALTLFDEQEGVDWPAWRALLRWYVEAGLQGVLIMGTTGEFPLLSIEERLAGIAAAQETIPPDRCLLVNVGAMTTRDAVRLAEAAAGPPRPADLLLAGPPYYYQGALRPERLRAHFETLARATPLPVLYYHIPKMSHFDPGAEQLSGVITAAPLVGIKDSDGVVAFQRALRERHRPETFLHLTGSLPAALESWAAEGDGAILGLAAALPAECAALWRLWRAGDTAGAEDLHRRLRAIWSLCTPWGIAGVREVLARTAPPSLARAALRRGRRPFTGVSPEGAEQIAAGLRAMGFTP